MAFIIDQMLENAFKEEFTPEQIKETVIYFLEPYFENKSVLNEMATNDQFLSLFSYIVVYHKDDTFAQLLKLYQNRCM